MERSGQSADKAVGPEVHLYQGLCAECFGVPRPRLYWSTQTKRVGFGELHRDLSKSIQEKILGNGGDNHKSHRGSHTGKFSHDSKSYCLG